jgi:hypothetical protein
MASGWWDHPRHSRERRSSVAQGRCLTDDALALDVTRAYPIDATFAVTDDALALDVTSAYPINAILFASRGLTPLE